MSGAVNRVDRDQGAISSPEESHARLDIFKVGKRSLLKE
jgi:hypothetical protein